MSHAEIDRLSIIESTIHRHITQLAAAKQLKLSVRQVKRLVSNYQLEGPQGLVSKRRGKPSKNRIANSVRQEALALIRCRYSDFSPTFAHEKLTECHMRTSQSRITGMDDQILSLYAKGMSTRDIVDAFQDMYGADISAGLVSQVTNSVLEKMVEWQSRPLDAVYPIVYLDCIVLKIRQDKRVINKAIYLVLGINIEGHKELLGMWVSENEGAKFWLSVLTDLQNRGVEHILIACVGGLKGFPDAINTVYPDAKIQLCIVHMVLRLSL